MSKRIFDALVNDLVKGYSRLAVDLIDAIKGLFFHAYRPTDGGHLPVGFVNYEFVHTAPLLIYYCNQLSALL